MDSLLEGRVEAVDGLRVTLSWACSVIVLFVKVPFCFVFQPFKPAVKLPYVQSCSLVPLPSLL